MIKMTEENIGEYGEQPIWLIFYDVQSENSKSLKGTEQDWLRSERVEIWYKLRYVYKCVPLQHSVWLIRGEETTHVKLEKLKDEWLEAYKANNFTAHISIFPVKTTDEGYKSFKVMEFDFILEWLGKIEKALNKALTVGKIGKKNVQAHTKKFSFWATSSTRTSTSIPQLEAGSGQPLRRAGSTAQGSGIDWRKHYYLKPLFFILNMEVWCKSARSLSRYWFG